MTTRTRRTDPSPEDLAATRASLAGDLRRDAADFRTLVDDGARDLRKHYEGEVIKATRTLPTIPPYDAVWGNRLAQLMVAVDGLEISEQVKNLLEHLARWEPLTQAALELLERARRGSYPRLILDADESPAVIEHVGAPPPHGPRPARDAAVPQ